MLNKQPDNSENKLRLLIKQAGHQNELKRSSAKQAIFVDLIEQPQHLDAVLSAIQSELRRARYLVCLLWLLFALIELSHCHDIIIGKWREICLLIVHGCCGYIAIRYPLTKTHRLKSLLQAVANIEDVRLVGAFLQAQQYLEVKAITREALGRLLPRMHYSDACLLNEQQRTILYQSLSGKDTNWTLTVLKALEQVGDGKAVPYVEKLANAPTTAQEVQEGAQECLAVLQARLDQQQVSQTLLRASGGSASPDVLLRAANPHDSTEPDQLLRAGNIANSSKE